VSAARADYLHDVSQLAREHELHLATHHACLDEHDVAADRRVVHPRSHAYLVFALLALRVDLGAPDQVVDLLGVDRDALHLAAGDLARHLARELPDLALKLADTGLTRVARDDLAQRSVRDVSCSGVRAVLLRTCRGTR